MIVAEGKTPGQIGRWRFWRSTDASGAECEFFGAALSDGKIRDVKVEAVGPDNSTVGAADVPTAGGE